MSDEFVFDVETVTHFMINTNPWAKLAGIKVLEVGDAKVKLQMPPSKNIENPFQAYHAGALFTFGETAAAALALASFDLTGGKAVLMKDGKIRYHKVVRDTIEIDASLDKQSIDKLNAEVAEHGKGNCPTTVVMKTLDGTEVCEATYLVHVRKN